MTSETQTQEIPESNPEIIITPEQLHKAKEIRSIYIAFMQMNLKAIKNGNLKFSALISNFYKKHLNKPEHIENQQSTYLYHLCAGSTPFEDQTFTQFDFPGDDSIEKFFMEQIKPLLEKKGSK